MQEYDEWVESLSEEDRAKLRLCERRIGRNSIRWLYLNGYRMALKYARRQVNKG